MNKLNLRVLQHEPFEGAGLIEDWALSKGHTIKASLVYDNEPLPKIDDFDWLVIMGGAMSVNDEAIYNWLKPEKELVSNAIAAKKVVLGICLGSQMIASALGKRVFKNTHKEIGWFPIKLTPTGKSSSFLSAKWDGQNFFHWHGETFDLPDDAVHLAFSEGCNNQAFSINNHVFGFQFHPETNTQTLNQMVTAGCGELVKDMYVMGPDAILKQAVTIKTTQALFFELLDKVEAGQKGAKVAF